MTNLESLRSLQKRIREATGPDRNLDWDIREAFNPGRMGQVSRYTLDPDGLGPCVALLEAVLPGAEFEISTLYGIAAVNLPLNLKDVLRHAGRSDGNKCLAFCEAIISALIAQEEAMHTVKAG